MQRLKAPKYKRALGSAPVGLKSKKDAAVQLVVLEFGVMRLQQELHRTQERVTACKAELAQKIMTRRKLLRTLGSGTGSGTGRDL